MGGSAGATVDAASTSRSASPPALNELRGVEGVSPGAQDATGWAWLHFALGNVAANVVGRVGQMAVEAGGAALEAAKKAMVEAMMAETEVVGATMRVGVPESKDLPAYCV